MRVQNINFNHWIQAIEDIGRLMIKRKLRICLDKRLLLQKHGMLPHESLSGKSPQTARIIDN